MVVSQNPRVHVPKEGEAEFTWSYTDEPHASRRTEMLGKYPEVKELYGACWWLRAKVFAVPLIQFGLAYLLRDVPLWLLALALVTWGASIAGHTTLAMHEASHNLMGMRGPVMRRLAGMVISMPIGLPAFISFMRYHLEHHRYQGEDGVDVDIPSDWETRFFTTPLRKTVWMMMQPLFYAFRPAVLAPKKPTMWEFINLLTAVAYDALVFYTLGARALAFVLLSGPIGTALHPLAGHFVAEHYTFEDTQETYSYYGPLNWLTVHVGFHNEHHDFPFVAGPKLHKVRELAREYYDTLPRHSSWTRVVWSYITSPTMGPHSRVKRQALPAEEVNRLNPLAVGRKPMPAEQEPLSDTE